MAKIYEKCLYTKNGYYASMFAKTKEEVLDRHLDVNEPIIFEIVISGVDCQDELVDHQCDHVFASWQWMVTTAIIIISILILLSASIRHYRKR